jgi:hypothetical protein
MGGSMQLREHMESAVETRNLKLETASKVNVVNVVNMWKSALFTT